MANGAGFDPNDKQHQDWRAKLETLVGIDLDPAIDLTVVDLTEKRAEAS